MKTGEPLGETMAVVLAVMTAHGTPMTDEELCGATDLRGGAVRPARLRLHRLVDRVVLEPVSYTHLTLPTNREV